MMQQTLIEYLLNALWQLPLLAGSAWLLVRLLRPTPRTQHAVWLALLVLAVIVPFLGMRETRTAPTEREIVAATPTHTMAGSGLHLGPDTTRWLVRLYLVSVGIGLFRIAWAWRTAKQLVDASHETCLDSRTMAAFEAYGLRLGVKLPRLRTSDTVSSPVVVGLRTAALLLPREFVRHTEKEMRAALCHELAHVQRHDYLVNLACEVVAVPLAWHPAMHEVLQRIRTTREMVCDAMAAEEMDSQLGYAKCLLALAHSMIGEHGMSLGLFSKHTLEERVMQLTEATTMKARAKAARAATGIAVIIATGVISTTFHVTPTMAQATAAPAPSVVAPAPAPVPAPAPAPMPEVSETAKTRVFHARHERKTLTPEEQLQVQRDLDVAHEQMDKAREMLNGPEFRQRIEDAQRQMAKSREILNSPEFRHQMEDARKQMEKATEMLNSPEFKRHLEDATREMSKAMIDNQEFQQKMKEAQDQMEQRIRDSFPPVTVPDDNQEDLPVRP